MKNPSLENFYLKIDKSILLVESFIEIKNLSFIIKACRLKPFDLFFSSKKSAYKIKLYKHWFDEFSNSLKIVKNKKLKIIYHDTIFLSKNIPCTDLYFGLLPEKIAKISKLIHVISLKGVKDKQYIITFLGVDNYLRSYLFNHQVWLPISPLVLGIKSLQNIASHLDIRYFHKILNKNNILPSCTATAEWLSYIHPSENFLEMLKKNEDIDLSSIFIE